MMNIIKARTPILALILFVFAVGYTVAAKVVVVPLGGDSMPSGMVSAFSSNACPDGWQYYSAAENRFLLGSPNAGGIGGANFHNHRWSYLNGSKLWRSFDSNGAFRTMLGYVDGIGGEGSGYYPVAPASGNAESFYTAKSTHYPPYISVRFCEKV